MAFAIRSRRPVPTVVLGVVLVLAGACGDDSVTEIVTGLRLAHYVPTPVPTVHRMLTLAGVGPGDVVYDLGSGDGRLVILAASDYGARGVGIELDEALVEEARRDAVEAGVSDRVRFVVGDLMTADLTEATVVTLYLIPSTLERLRPRFLAQLPPDARIVSHAFSMGAWAPDVTERFMDELARPHVVYLWRLPASPACNGARETAARLPAPSTRRVATGDSDCYVPVFP